MGRSGPPKRFFCLVNDLAPGQPDVVQVTLGPAAQFAPLALPVAPGVKHFAELGENAIMMIYHLIMRTSGHFHLLNLRYLPKYLPFMPLLQTTLCSASHDINS
jgi:hypothetical protein